MKSRLPKPRIAARMAIAIVLAVVSSFLLDQALRTLIPPPPFLVVQRGWIVDSVAKHVLTRETSEAPSPYLEFITHRQPPFETGGNATVFAREFQAALATTLGKPPGNVRVRAETFSDNFWERSASTATVIIPALPVMLGSAELATSRSAVLGRLDIAVRRDDGQWLVASARRTTDARWHYARNLLGVVGNLLILAVFSFWMARSIIAPLNRLAGAAEQLGREREPTLITGMRLPEFAAIADTFNTMQIRLKRFVDERIQMLAAISHDLRTPLTRLRLLAEYVEDDDQRTQLRTNVADMETMVADALAFMREEAGQEGKEVVDIAALLISLADTSSDLGEDVVYEGPDHLDLLCRPVAMKRTFANLIANGCKYGEAVWIVLKADEAAISVIFRDRGPGIAPEDAERAFAPFVRLETSRGRETGGTGLGLTISRDVVRSHGGEISFDRTGGAFLVCVRLPR